MKYKVDKDIIIYSLEDFNPEHILECGQVFSYEKIDNNYVVYSQDKKAVIKKEENAYRIITKDIKFMLSEYKKEKRNSIGLKNTFEEIMAEILPIRGKP